MSTATNKKLQETVTSIENEVKNIHKLLKSFSIDMAIIKENSNLTQIKVGDLSCKVDMDISTLNITSSKAATKSVKAGSADPGKKPNIMSYFKLKWKEDPKLLSSIISETEVKELFTKYASEIAAKSKNKDTLNNFKATLAYKDLIKLIPENLKRLRAMKEKEESSNIVVDSEIKENDIDNDNEELVESETDEVIGPDGDTESSDDE